VRNVWLSACLTFFLIVPAQRAAASTIVSGPVTSIVSSGEFVFQTGAPRGHVGVFYSASMVVPSGSRIAVGQSVTVDGSFNSLGQLVATQVTVGSSGSTGPYHIATYAYDSYFGQSQNVSAASINLLLSYAQGNDKSVLDCHSGTRSCKAVFYVNVNHEFDYSPSSCVNHPDADVLAAASESWFVHNPGYNDSAHRIYGKSASGCLIWLMNPMSVGMRSWWLSYLRNVADSYDLYFLDSDPMDVPDATYFPSSGGGCNPWPSVCRSTQEIPDNPTEVLARATFANAMNHKNGSPMHFFFQQASFNTTLDMSAFTASNRLIGITCEGCVSTYASPVRPTLYARVLNEMAAADASPGAYLLTSHGNFPAGSALQILQRLVTTGIVWLAYSEGHTVVQPDLESNTNNLPVWPEDLIYPSGPVQSMISSSNDLQVSSGIWRREFTTCYQMGHLFGHCAVIVNSTANALAVPAGWLSQSYHHVITLSGGDVLSGGIANVGGATFVPNVTKLPASGALLLAP